MVIGGGVIGLCTALSLAEQGVAVTLVEKGRVGAEQFSRNWGWCRTAGRVRAEVPLAAESIRLWEQLGAAVGFTRAGTALLCESEREVEWHAAWLKTAQDYQINSRLLSSSETARLLPEAGPRFSGCLHTLEDGRAEPTIAALVLAARVRGAGAVILEGCAARGLDLMVGRVSGVVTERGLMGCEAVVLAGGA